MRYRVMIERTAGTAADEKPERIYEHVIDNLDVRIVMQALMPAVTNKPSRKRRAKVKSITPKAA